MGRGARTTAHTSSDNALRQPQGLVQLRDAGPYGGDETTAAKHFFAAGGCAHLALAIVSLYPQARLAAQWYSDHGHELLAHMVAYDPHTRRAFDVFGTHADPQQALAAYRDQYATRCVLDASPEEIAEQMNIDWRPDEPWLDEGVFEGAAFVAEHSLAY